MALGLYIFFMALGTLIAGGSWGMVLYYFDPFKVGIFAVIAFYITLFLFLTGFFALAGLTIRRIYKKKDLVFKQVSVSFRQGVWFSVIILFALFLASHQVFTLINLAAFIFLFAILEFIFISHTKKHA